MGHQISPTVTDEYVNACVWISSFSFSNFILYFSSSSSSSTSSSPSSETLNIYLKDLEVEIISACLSVSDLLTQAQSLPPRIESQDQIKLYHSHPLTPTLEEMSTANTAGVFSESFSFE